MFRKLFEKWFTKKIRPLPEAPWFSIDEDVYLVYLLKGYEIKVTKSGLYVYFLLNGKIHRENGPAGIWENGSVEYWQNDNHHREDGPAIIFDDFVQYWINGSLHREDGPAVIWSNGPAEYWLNDVEYSQEDYYKAITDGNY